MRAVLLASVVAAALVAVPQAAAAPTWLATETISAPNDLLADPGDDPPVRVAAGPAGHAVAAWLEPVAGGQALRTSLHRPGAAWTPVAGSPSDGLGGIACKPHVAMDRTGAAIVAWVQAASGPFCTGTGTVRYATLAPGAAAWSPSVPLETSTSWGFMTAAAHPDGTFVVAYSWLVSGTLVLRAAVGSVAGGPAAPSTIADIDSETISNLVAAAGSGGDVAVQWARQASGQTAVNVVVAVRPRGAAAFLPVFPLTAHTTGAGAGLDGDLAIDAAGNVLSVFPGAFSADGVPIMARLRTASNGAWQLPEVVGTPVSSSRADAARAVFAADGTATAAWSEVDPLVPPVQIRRVHAATRPPGVGSPWASAALGDPFDGDAGLSLAGDGAGSEVVAWVGTGTGGPEVRAAVRRPGAGFSPATVVGLGEFRFAAMDATANAVVASISPAGEARIAVYDATPPAITALSMPAALTTGEAGAFGAAVVDAWAGLAPGSPVWSFGDGTSSAGPAAGHPYAAPGSFTASLTATDAVGNTAVASGTVAVSAPPVDPATLPAVTLARVRLAASYRQSRLKGTVTVAGRSNLPATLTVRVLSTGSRPRVLAQRRLAVRAGSFTVALRLPATLVPGRYRLELRATSGGISLPVLARRLELKSPPEGVVGRAFAHASANGPPATRLRGPRREVHATFVFAALPRRGVITVRWAMPGGRLLPGVDKPRERRVRSDVRIRQPGRHLAPGVWRARLFAGRVLVAQVAVRIG